MRHACPNTRKHLRGRSFDRQRRAQGSGSRRNSARSTQNLVSNTYPELRNFTFHVSSMFSFCSHRHRRGPGNKGKGTLPTCMLRWSAEWRIVRWSSHRDIVSVRDSWRGRIQRIRHKNQSLRQRSLVKHKRRECRNRGKLKIGVMDVRKLGCTVDSGSLLVAGINLRSWKLTGESICPGTRF